MGKMKDKADAVYDEGYQAGIDSESKSTCPYEGIEAEYWHDGWEDGEHDSSQE